MRGPAAAGGQSANVREANLQAKPIPKGQQNLEVSRGAVTFFIKRASNAESWFEISVFLSFCLSFFFFFFNNVTYNCKDS